VVLDPCVRRPELLLVHQVLRPHGCARGGPRRRDDAGVGRRVPCCIEGREACWTGGDGETTHEQLPPAPLRQRAPQALRRLRTRGRHRDRSWWAANSGDVQGLRSHLLGWRGGEESGQGGDSADGAQLTFRRWERHREKVKQRGCTVSLHA
jgi:hypothetical protein